MVRLLPTGLGGGLFFCLSSFSLLLTHPLLILLTRSQWLVMIGDGALSG